MYARKLLSREVVCGMQPGWTHLLPVEVIELVWWLHWA